MLDVFGLVCNLTAFVGYAVYPVTFFVPEVRGIPSVVTPCGDTLFVMPSRVVA